MQPVNGRRSRRTGVIAALCAVLMLVGMQQGVAVPPPPPNPSDRDIQDSQEAADSAAGEVGRLSGLVTKTQGQIDQLRADLELKGELVKKAMIDAQLADQDVVEAEAAAKATARNAQLAGGKIKLAEDDAARFAAASFRQGSVLGSMSAFLDAGSPADLLSRQQLIGQISSSQLDVIQHLQTTRNVKANLDSAARATADEARDARTRAVKAQQVAKKAQADAAGAFRTGQQQLDALQVQLDGQQDAYQQALSQVSDLKSQREQFEEWLQEKRAEEERLRKEAEARARAAAEAAAAKAAAEKAAAEQLAAEQAAAARAAAAAAAAKAAAEHAAAVKAAAQQAAAAKSAAAARAAKAAAASRAAKAKQAASRSAAERAAAATAAASKAAAAKAAADRKAAQEAAAAKAAADKASRSRSAADRSAAARAAAGKAAAARAAARSAAALRAARQAAQRLAQQRKNNKTYYASCADAEAAGAAPIHRGAAGYRKGLDRNGNGVACEVLPDSAAKYGGGGGGSSSGSGGSGQSSSRSDQGSNSPGQWSDSKGEQAVQAALRWIGTPYSWGGGSSSGPTTGICGPDGAWNDCNIVGFDCSGLTSYAWAQVGVSIPAYSVYQYTLGQHVGMGSLMPGDLMFYANNTSDPNSIHHVTMYIGNGQMVEAPYSGAYVHTTGADFGNGYIGATRPGT